MFDMLHHLRADHLAGRRGGLYAVCSSRREVLEAAIALARDHGRPLLVEATANQVNQFGGYTGMTPEAFASSLRAMAAAMDFPQENLLLGADHLGPYVWKNEPAAAAMAKAAELARQCVAAGFHKLHLDAGFGCCDDPPQGLAAGNRRRAHGGPVPGCRNRGRGAARRPTAAALRHRR